MAQEDISLTEEKWSSAEQWVWERNRQGCVADFNHGRASSLDPSSPDEWPGERELRPIFFATMLTREPYRSDFMRFGMRVQGAWIREPLILEGVSLPHRLSLERCRFDGAADFSELRADRQVSFAGSAFHGTLKLINARVDGDLSLASTQFAAELDAQGLRVTSDLVLTASRGIQADFRQTVIGGRVFGRGSRFRKRLDMEGMKVASDLFINSARIQSLHLTDAQIGGQLVLSGSRCVELSLQFVSIASDLDATGGCRFGSINVVGGRIEGDAKFAGSRFRGTAEMDDLRVGLGLNMNEVAGKDGIELNGSRVGRNLNLQYSAWGGTVQLKWAKIGGQINCGAALIRGTLDLEAAHVVESVYLRDGSDPLSKNTGARTRGQFATVSLKDAKVDATVFARNSIFAANVDLDGLDAGYLWLRTSTFEADVNFQSGTVSRNVDLSGSRFEKSVDFSGSTIGGALELGCPDIGGPTWGIQSKFTLRDASAAVLRDRPPDLEDPNGDAWPAQMVQNGFAYTRLGGHAKTPKGEVPMSDRPVSWYTAWLEKDEQFSNDSYRRLADILAAQGEPGKANSIRFAARERLRRHTKGIQWLGLTVLKMTIGYGIGYGYLLSLAWVAGLSALGVLVFEYAPHGRVPGLGNAWLFSLDQLLPVIKLDPRADDIAKGITGWQLGYLAAHRVLGFVLSSFVVAGLSGITQK